MKPVWRSYPARTRPRPRSRQPAQPERLPFDRAPRHTQAPRPSMTSAPFVESVPPHCVDIDPCPRCLECGAPFHQAPTGRPRTTCNDRCRRALDHRRRKLRRRVIALDLWEQVSRHETLCGYERHEVDRAIADLTDEVRELARDGVTP